MSLKKECIFILGTTKFDHPFESTSYTIAKNLAHENTVYYIENPFTWRDYFRIRKSDKFSRRKGLFSKNSDGILATNIPGLNVVVCPFLFSINFLPEGRLYRFLLGINEAIIANRIKKIISNAEIDKYYYINSFTFHYPNIAHMLKPVLKVYHCVDPLVIDFDTKHGIQSELQLIRESDLIICTSKQLTREKKSINRNTHFIPNAADISHTSGVLNKDLDVHESIASLKKPVIGYFGNIERRIDFDLIRILAKKHADMSFVFAGPVSKEFVPEWFFNTKNIFLTGRFDYEQLPAVLKGFDVAMIPFKKDEHSNTIFPLKLFEYLGSGKPTIATDFNPDLEEFTKGVVPFCSGPDKFSDAIINALHSNSEDKMDARIAIAKENTWSKRTQEFSNLLETNTLMELI